MSYFMPRFFYTSAGEDESKTDPGTPPISDAIVIAITGVKGSGKDTAAAFMEPHLREGYKVIHIADELKAKTAEVFGVPKHLFHSLDTKDTPLSHLGDQSPRDMVCALSDILTPVLGPSHWLREALNRAHAAPPDAAGAAAGKGKKKKRKNKGRREKTASDAPPPPLPQLLITDLRLLEEFEELYSRYGADLRVVHVDRGLPAGPHHTETSVASVVEAARHERVLATITNQGSLDDLIVRVKELFAGDEESCE